MTPRRRNQLLTAGAGAVVIAVVLVATLAGGNGNDGHGRQVAVPTATIPPQTDPHAQDRREIQAVARAYQAAFNPHSSKSPCDYLDGPTRQKVTQQGRRGELEFSPHPVTCTEGLRRLGNTTSLFYRATPRGIDANKLQFDPQTDPLTNTPLSNEGVPQSLVDLPLAVAKSANGYLFFVKERGRWRVDASRGPAW